MGIDAGMFSMKTAKDFYQKLQKDFERLREKPGDPHICFDFFVTAEHLPEWHCGALLGIRPNSSTEAELEDLKKEAGKLRRSHPCLKMCSHLANNAKHFVATTKRHDSVESTTTMNIVSLDLGTGTARTPQTAFSIICGQDDAQALNLRDGQAISVIELGRRILDFWQDRLFPSQPE